MLGSLTNYDVTFGRRFVRENSLRESEVQIFLKDVRAPDRSFAPDPNHVIILVKCPRDVIKTNYHITKKMEAKNLPESAKRKSYL